jgi:heme exporter protein A
MTAAPLLYTQNLSCERGDRRLFTGLSFTLDGGRVLQIEGANGSGKTSLLRIVSGLLRPDSGRVFWQGESIHAQRSEYLRQIHYLGHLPGIKLELTPTEILRFTGAWHGGKPGLSIDEALERVELYGFEDEPAATLSAGQRRRISLAGLLVSQARLWILDEPFTTLDVSGSAVLEQLIDAHVQNDGCVIMASHSKHRLAPDRVMNLFLHA